MFKRKFLQTVAAAVCALTLSSFATADEAYPNKTVRLVIGFPPGGATDIVARTLANRLAERWKQPVVVDNKPGGNTVISALEITKSKPDGYTLSLALDITLVMNQHLFKSPKYDPFKELTALGSVAEFPMLLMSRRATGADSFAGFVQIAKQDPDSGRVGVAAVLNTVALKLIGEAVGIDPAVVQYKGTGDATLGLLRGDVNYQLDVDVSAAQHIQKGDVKVLAVTGPRRLTTHPNAPTLSELGYPKATMTAWFGLIGPAGMPKILVEKINADVRWAMDDPKVQGLLADRSIQASLSSPEEMTARMKRDSDKYGPIIRKNNLLID
jgi:tripartite-type tricarboxylate transporter receptor subunit TctC